MYTLAWTRTHIHAFIQGRPKAKRQTDNDDWSARLVPNLSPFRLQICHNFDLASMGMHPKFCESCKSASLARQREKNTKSIPCLVRGESFTRRPTRHFLKEIRSEAGRGGLAGGFGGIIGGHGDQRNPCRACQIGESE